MKSSKLLIASLFLMSINGATAQERASVRLAGNRGAGTPFRIRFINTDVSDIIQAISLRTKANIVFPSQLKKAISINFEASSTEDALMNVSAASGLTFKRINGTYIMALPNELRQAVYPFGTKAIIDPYPMPPADAAKLLEDAIPTLTAKLAGAQLSVTGSAEDMQEARALLADRSGDQGGAVTDTISVKYADVAQLSVLLKNIYDVKAEPVSKDKVPGGMIGLSGMKSKVKLAIEAVRAMDTKALSAGGAIDREFRIYNIAYGSAPALKDFLTKAVPNLNVIIAPASYSPASPSYAPISAGSSSTSSSGSGASSLGSSGSSGASTGTPAATGGTDSGNAVSSTPLDYAKMLVLSGVPEDLDQAFKMLGQVDIAPLQVEVEVKVVDTSPEHAEQIGLQYNFSRFDLFQQPTGSTVTPPSGNGFALGTVTQALGGHGPSMLPLGFNATLSAMVTNKEAKILAKPHVSVKDNDNASIFIGDTYRVQLSNSGITGNLVTVQEFPVGILLLVRPRVNADGRITMRVHPQVSTITAIGAGGFPQTSQREADTTLVVRDGETIMLGGLIRDEFTKTEQSVPFLSKLPLIGELFKYRNKTHRESEIMVFITTKIIRDNQKPNK